MYETKTKNRISQILNRCYDYSLGGVEEFRNKYPEWCVTRDSESTSNNGGADGLPNLRIGSDGLRTSSRPVSLNNRRPGSLGSRSASDSEEERPDSALESGEIRADDHHRLNGCGVGPPEFGSGFSLGLSVGLRLGLESEPLPPLMLDNISVDQAGLAGGNLAGIVSMDDSDPLADPGFPVEILPNLFLGNAQNSRDCDALDKHHIRVSLIHSFIHSFVRTSKFCFCYQTVCCQRDAQPSERV